MSPSVRVAIKDHFSELTDPRRREVIYPLINVVTIAVCAVVCGADDFVAIAAWGRTKREWLAKFLDLSRGIPSHDRFNALFAAIRPAEFEKCLLSWITALHEISDGQIVAIDGKTLRRSFDAASSKAAIHMVSAWATTNRISLGQVVVDDKSNEITAIPKLLQMLELSGCLVTIDAMGCQTQIAHDIVAAKADYVLAVKGNQPTLHAESPPQEERHQSVLSASDRQRLWPDQGQPPRDSRTWTWPRRDSRLLRLRSSRQPARSRSLDEAHRDRHDLQSNHSQREADRRSAVLHPEQEAHRPPLR